MARPKKEPHERRTSSTRADLTPAEKEHVRAQAQRAGLSEADYVRRRVLGFQVSPAPSRVEAQATAALVNEVNRLGVNVNQLARAVHTDRPAATAWQTLAGECERVLARLVRTFPGHGS